MAYDDHAGEGNVPRWALQLVALWLAILLPITTMVEYAYYASYLARLPQWLNVVTAVLMIAMITLSVWAAIGVWQRHPDARSRVNAALLMTVGTYLLTCAPLSILMSAPPYFVPVILVSLICIAILDAWYGPEVAVG